MLSHADNTEDPAPQSSPSSPPPSALRAERLSADEARAVIDLWQAEQVEQTGLTDRPAVPDVAEGLDLSVEDVQRLLAEVRTRRDAESRLLAYEQELAEIRLAEQKRTLAEEQRKLAEIQRQRAEFARIAADAQQREDPDSLLPLPLLLRLPQDDVPGWHHGVFSAADEAAELMASQRTETKRSKNANRAFWQLAGFIVFVTLACYGWAVVANYNVSSQPCSAGTHHESGNGPCVFDGSERQ